MFFFFFSGLWVQVFRFRVLGLGFTVLRFSVFGSYRGKLTHRPQSSSFLGLPYRVLNMNPQKELLWGLWVEKTLQQRLRVDRLGVSDRVSGLGMRLVLKI